MSRYELSPEFDTLISEPDRWPYVRELFAGYVPAPRPSALAKAGPVVEQAWERMRREFREFQAATQPLRVSAVTDTGTIVLGRTEEI